MSVPALRKEAPQRPVTPLEILAAELEEIGERLDAVDGVEESLRRRVRRARAMASGLDPYLSAVTTPESAALANLSERTRAHDWGPGFADGRVGALEAEMLSGHVEGQVLKFLVALTRARRVLEIGMFTGYSALAMAEALPRGGTLVGCEIDAGAARIARECFDASPDGHKIEVRVGPASTTLAELEAEGAVFDLVFVDADKAGYARYLDAILAGGLLGADGVVCVDNTLLQGQPYLDDHAERVGPVVAAGVSIAVFNAAVAADPRVEQVVVPLRDGLTLIRRTAPADPGLPSRTAPTPTPRTRP